MLRNKSIPKGSLVLAGLAAFAYYKYSKMSEEEKRNLVSSLREQGKKLYDQYVPENIKKMFGQDEDINTPGDFEERSYYTS